MTLSGKVAIVTGAGQGIGRVTALAMARAGARVVVNDVSDERLEEVRATISELSGEVLTVNADVSIREQVSRMVKETIDVFGKLDIVVNNVGVGLIHGGGIELPVDEFKRLININLKSQYLMCYFAVPYMKKQKKGKIVNISSAAGRYRASMSDLAYTTAKAGVLGLTRFLAGELGPYNINVNCVVPGNVLTEQGTRDWNSLPSEKREELVSITPLRRMASMEDLANAIIFLSSESSDYITGVSLDVNGGWWMS